ncbi:lipoprotein [Marinomonas sp. THO17]
MMLKWFVVLVFSAFIVACGNKGALYLPDNNTLSQQESSVN